MIEVGENNVTVSLAIKIKMTANSLLVLIQCSQLKCTFSTNHGRIKISYYDLVNSLTRPLIMPDKVKLKNIKDYRL